MNILSTTEVEELTQKILHRPKSIFARDMAACQAILSQEIKGKSALVIGGAGTIGGQFIRELLAFRPERLMVVDTNENGLTELVRDIRSSDIAPPNVLTTFPMDLGHPLTLEMIKNEGAFDIVANFAALKHVRSEKNLYTTAYIIDNNLIKAELLLRVLLESPPKHFFCVSTDKAANPINVMGATKRLMEDLVFSAGDFMKVSTARFANVAFSNGSLLDGFLHRISKEQPLSMPGDVRRYFVSRKEAGELCLLAAITAKTRDVYTPRLDPLRDQYYFTYVAKHLVERLGFELQVLIDDKDIKGDIKHLLCAGRYPCVVLPADTTGEKSEEVFLAEGESLDGSRFEKINVVRPPVQFKTLDEFSVVTQELTSLFGRAELNKEDLIRCLMTYVPTFRHKELNVYLDSRM